MRVSRHHERFLAALAAGLLGFAAGTVAAVPESAALRVIIAGDLFFVVYLVLTTLYLRRTTAEDLRARAANPDEGLPLILCVTGATVTISLVSVLLLLDHGGSAGLLGLPLAVAVVPLGWLTMHAMVAFHYANLFYAPGAAGDAGGLNFPETPEPGIWDFLYYAYVIGMTAQVSDVAVTRETQRRVTLFHGIFSFFYNAVILALAVNAAANLRG
jgi:uncharacterized membrane protein